MIYFYIHVITNTFFLYEYINVNEFYCLTWRKEDISFLYISLFLYSDVMFEYYIIFWSFSLNDIYWIYVLVYIYSQFQKQADLFLYITGRCLHYHHFIIGFDVMMLLFRAIWNFAVRHKQDYLFTCCILMFL